MSQLTATNKTNKIKQLQAFCRAAQNGSISKAAERLNLSQPSVSLQIQSLEKDLDTVLFERSGPKIRLTPAGELLLKMALPLVEGVEKLSETFAARLGSVSTGTLSIASGHATLLYILPELIKEFSSLYPQIDVRLHNVTGKDGMKLMREDEVDFAVGSMLDIPDDMVYHPIYNFTPSLITALDHPLTKIKKVTLEDISPYGLILPPRHLSTFSLVDLVFSQQNVPYKIALEVGGWEVIKRYVELDVGISIVTNICLRDNDGIAVIPMDKYFPARSYGAVIRRGKFLSPQAKCFLELMDTRFFDNQSIPPGKLPPVQEALKLEAFTAEIS